MTKRPESSRHVMNLFQHLIYFFCFSRRTFYPRPFLPAGRHRTGFSDAVFTNNDQWAFLSVIPYLLSMSL